MKTIHTTAQVTEDGQLVVPAPPDVAPGAHAVVVVVDERPLREGRSALPDFPTANYGGAFDGLTFSREEMYGDGGR